MKNLYATVAFKSLTVQRNVRRNVLACTIWLTVFAMRFAFLNQKHHININVATISFYEKQSSVGACSFVFVVDV